jgi:hypothetical protein
MPLFAIPKKAATRQTLRALAFRSGGLGFTTASLTKLHTAVSQLEKLGADGTVAHNFFEARFFGNAESEFTAARKILDELRRDPDFEDSTVGVAEGQAEHEIDVMRICGAALKNARV